MEFGENLKRAREGKGLTQQTLADKLYVTRQAVSRWECGSRYPDLLTTKCIADVLDVSVEALLSDDPMTDFSEKQEVLQDKFSERIVSALYAVLFSLSAIKTVQSLISTVIALNYKSTLLNVTSAIQIIAPILLYCLIAVLSGITFIKSVRNTITPKSAGIIGIVFYAYYALKTTLIMIFCKSIWRTVLLTAVLVAFIVLIYAYFFNNKSRLSTVICSGCIASVIYFLISAVSAGFAMYKMSESGIVIFSTVFDLFIVFSFAGVLCAQTIALERKRKLCNSLI
ncbi:MAG: helix-turn-helix domain-containing protein [Clostridia bacterium]|nr:helix-turn-helix domain-containing protein [Clostridia bacterium]